MIRTAVTHPPFGAGVRRSQAHADPGCSSRHLRMGTWRCQHGGRQPHKPGRELWHALQAAFIGSACADAALGPALSPAQMQLLAPAHNATASCRSSSLPPTTRASTSRPAGPWQHSRPFSTIFWLLSSLACTPPLALVVEPWTPLLRPHLTSLWT